jgi:hypothetical protein
VYSTFHNTSTTPGTEPGPETRTRTRTKRRSLPYFTLLVPFPTTSPTNSLIINVPSAQPNPANGPHSIHSSPNLLTRSPHDGSQKRGRRSRSPPPVPGHALSVQTVRPFFASPLFSLSLSCLPLPFPVPVAQSNRSFGPNPPQPLHLVVIPAWAWSRRLRSEVGRVCCTAAGTDGEGTLTALLNAFELAGIAVVGIRLPTVLNM